MYTLNIPLDDLSDEMVVELAIHLGFRDRPVFKNDDLFELIHVAYINKDDELFEKISEITKDRKIEYEKEYDNYTADAIEWLIDNYSKGYRR